MASWFDQQTGMINLDEKVAQSETFQKIMEDRIVTGDEIKAQADMVIGLLRELDACLDTHEKELVEKLLTELAVLYAVSQTAELQSSQLG